MGIATVLAGANAVMALTTVIVSVVAWQRTSMIPRSFFMVSALYAWSYVFLYAILFFGWIDPLTWVAVTRGWSIGVWPIVWMQYPLWAIALSKKVALPPSGLIEGSDEE